MSDKYPWEECPRCKAIFTGTWDSLNAKIVHCNCTQGIGGDFEQAKIDWLANFKRKIADAKAKEKS